MLALLISSNPGPSTKITPTLPYSIQCAICQAKLLQNVVTFYTFYTFDANVTKSIKATNGTKQQVAVLLLGMASSLVATHGCQQGRW